MPLLVGFGIALVVSLIFCSLVVYLTEVWLPKWIALIRYRRSQQLKGMDVLRFTNVRMRFLEDVVADVVTRTPYWVDTKSQLICKVGAGLVRSDKSFLVVNLNKGPFKGFWGLPAGYLKLVPGVEPLEIAREEVLHQIGDWCSDQKAGSWLAYSGKWWSKTSLWPIESKFLPTEVVVLRFEVDRQSRIPSNGDVRWCTARETLRLPGKIHPVLSDVLTDEFNEPQLAEELFEKARGQIRQPSEWRKWAEGITSKMLKDRQQKAFMEDLVRDTLAETPRETLEKDQLKDFVESLAVNMYNEDFIKYVKQYKH